MEDLEGSSKVNLRCTVDVAYAGIYLTMMMVLMMMVVTMMTMFEQMRI